MAGNVCISNSSERIYCKVNPVDMPVSGVVTPTSIQDAKADTFYKFGTVGFLKFQLTDVSDIAFQEYIFEFTPSKEDMYFAITSKYPIYWVRPITLTVGHLYQVSVVNGIVMWVEVIPE